MADQISLKFFTNHNLASAAILIRANGKLILIDPGMHHSHPGKKKLLSDFRIADLDFVIITHYHGDHTNLLGEIFKDPAFRGTVLSHPATVDIVRSYGRLSHIDESRFNRINYRKSFVLGKDMTVTFYNSGHVLGSAMLFFQIGQKRILISGDMGAQYLPMVRPPEQNLPAGQIDLMVMDGKNADRERDYKISKDPFGDILYNKLADCFQYDDGNVLIYSPVTQIPLLLYSLNPRIIFKAR